MLALALDPTLPEPPVSLAFAPSAVDVSEPLPLPLPLPPFPPLPLLPEPPLPDPEPPLPPDPELDFIPLSVPARTLPTVRGEGLSPHDCVTCTFAAPGLSEDLIPLLLTS